MDAGGSSGKTAGRTRPESSYIDALSAEAVSLRRSAF